MKTATLDAQEWRAVCADNSIRLTQFIQSIEGAPSDIDLKAIDAHYERMKVVLFEAWKRSVAPPKEVEQTQTTPAVWPSQPTPYKITVNGDLPPPRTDMRPAGMKRKGGWPKGKPRPRKTNVLEAGK